MKLMEIMMRIPRILQDAIFVEIIIGRKYKLIKMKSCPCHHTTSCHPDCTCINGASSRGCARCCSYGSKDQQKKAAERIADAIDEYEAWDETFGKVVDNDVYVVDHEQRKLLGKCK